MLKMLDLNKQCLTRSASDEEKSFTTDLSHELRISVFRGKCLQSKCMAQFILREILKYSWSY